MTNLTTFYVVFISQIVLLSVYFPSKLIKRMRFIQRKYPASSHPKLYPKSVNFYQKSTTIYGISNALIFILGWVVIYYIDAGSLIGKNGINPMLPWTYFMIQMIPTGLIEVFGLRMLKLMKQEDTRTQKSAELVPRHLFQYISPMLLGLVIIAFIGFVLFAFYLEGFEFKITGKAFIMSAFLLLTYVLFYLTSAWLIRGKKCDPYQSPKDRTKIVTLVVKTYCYTMIASAFFMGFSIAATTYELKSLMPLAMSLFLQFIVVVSTGFVLQKNRLEDINFDVYKADALSK